VKETFTVQDIQLIVFDFDGVMTNNQVILNEHGEESVIVNRADGLGVSLLRQHAIPMLILSTEENRVVTARASKLNIPAIQGVADKAVSLQSFCVLHGIDLSNVLYVGNDINDLEAMRISGLRAAPSDAHKTIRDLADIVLESPGGSGVIRELYDLIQFPEETS
jgi:YrbI family 3-deoxy-D-manno-octulosonate 8-phosphate phosphatase